MDRDGPVGGESASNGGEVAWRVRWRQRRVSSDLEKEGTGGSWWTDGSAGDEGEALLVPSGGWGRMGSELRINDGRGSG